MTLIEQLELTYCTCAPDYYLLQRDDPNCAWCLIGTDVVQATLADCDQQRRKPIKFTQPGRCWCGREKPLEPSREYNCICGTSYPKADGWQPRYLVRDDDHYTNIFDERMSARLDERLECATLVMQRQTITPGYVNDLIAEIYKAILARGKT